MKSAVETLSPTRAKLTVEVPFEELKPSLDKAYKTIAQQINVPGFRRGKVPPMVIDRQVGRGAILDQAINEALPQFYIQALQDNDLQPLAQPDIEVTKLEDNESLEFTAEVDVKPEITLPAYDDLTAQVEDVAVTDEDVEEQVQALRERFATLVDVDRAAADGDFVVIDLVAQQRRRDRRGRRADRHVLQGRPRRHARRPRRGPRRHDRRRGEDLHLAAGRRRPGGPGRRRHRQGRQGPGAGAARSTTTSSPSWPRSSTPPRSSPRTSASGSAGASASSRPPPRATPSSRRCSSASTSRSRRPSSPTS